MTTAYPAAAVVYLQFLVSAGQRAHRASFADQCCLTLADTSRKFCDHVVTRTGAAAASAPGPRASRCRPKYVGSDNGREFISDTLKTWLFGQAETAVFIAKASPTQNCYIERFNSPRSLGDVLSTPMSPRRDEAPWPKHRGPQSAGFPDPRAPLRCARSWRGRQATRKAPHRQRRECPAAR